VSTNDQIRDILLAKADAIVRRDGSALDALIHPDFVYVNAAGRTFSKAEYVDYFCTSGQIVFRRQKFSGLEVRPFPGLAVATMVVHDSFVVDGKIIDATYQSLLMFAELEGRWQWVAGQTRTAG
jgi:Domain of unknown function (DUF4440)